MATQRTRNDTNGVRLPGAIQTPPTTNTVQTRLTALESDNEFLKDQTQIHAGTLKLLVEANHDIVRWIHDVRDANVSLKADNEALTTANEALAAANEVSGRGNESSSPSDDVPSPTNETSSPGDETSSPGNETSDQEDTTSLDVKLYNSISLTPSPPSTPPSPKKPPSITLPPKPTDAKPWLPHSLANLSPIDPSTTLSISQMPLYFTPSYIAARLGSKAQTENYHRITVEHEAPLNIHGYFIVKPSLDPMAPTVPGHHGAILGAELLISGSGTDCTRDSPSLLQLPFFSCINEKNNWYIYLGHYTLQSSDPIDKPSFERIPANVRKHWFDTDLLCQIYCSGLRCVKFDKGFYETLIEGQRPWNEGYKDVWEGGQEVLKVLEERERRKKKRADVKW